MTADLIFRDAKVITVDGDFRVAEAVAVRGARIAAVGAEADVMGLAGPGTRIIECQGRAVIPGLIDGHAHMDREGLKDALPSLAGCVSIADIVERIAALAARAKPGEWIVTMPVGEPPIYADVPETLAGSVSPTAGNWTGRRPTIRSISAPSGAPGAIARLWSRSPIHKPWPWPASPATPRRRRPVSRSRKTPKAANRRAD